MATSPTIEMQRVLRQIRRDCLVVSGLALDALIHAHTNDPRVAIVQMQSFADNIARLAKHAHETTRETVAPTSNNGQHDEGGDAT